MGRLLANRRVSLAALAVALLIGTLASWGAVYVVANGLTQRPTSANALNHATVAAPTALAGKTIFLGTNGGVVALSASSGAIRWSYPSAQQTVSVENPHVTSMALCAGALYIALINGPVVALRASDGARLWSSAVVSQSNAPTVACGGGVVYAAAHVGTPQAVSDRWLFALRASDGHELWRFTADEPILSAPIVAAGDVVFGTTDRLFYVVNAQTGTLVWRSFSYAGIGGGAALEGYNHSGPLSISMVAIGTTLYINAKVKHWNDKGKSYIEPDTFVRSVIGPDAVPGVRAGAPFEGLPAAYPPVVSNGIVYAEGGGGLWATNLEGAGGWFHNSGGTQYTGPTLGGNALYVCAFDGNTYALSVKDGHELWRAQTQGGTRSQPPAFASGALFVAGGSDLYAMRASDGAPIWRAVMPNGPIWLSPLVG